MEKVEASATDDGGMLRREASRIQGKILLRARNEGCSRFLRIRRRCKKRGMVPLSIYEFLDADREEGNGLASIGDLKRVPKVFLRGGLLPSDHLLRQTPRSL